MSRLTRKERAARLRALLTRGPAYSAALVSDPDAPAGEDAAFVPANDFSARAAEEAKRQYRRWVEPWILAELDDLLPELRRAKK